jgi:hypothetical protein
MTSPITIFVLDVFARFELNNSSFLQLCTKFALKLTQECSFPEISTLAVISLQEHAAIVNQELLLANDITNYIFNSWMYLSDLNDII